MLTKLQFRSDKIVYRRYAGLFFCCCVDSNDNELAYLEAIHLFVEVLGTLQVPSNPHFGAGLIVQTHSSRTCAS